MVGKNYLAKECAIILMKILDFNCKIGRYHNIYGPIGTFDGGREKAPAALCRKIAKAKINN